MLSDKSYGTIYSRIENGGLDCRLCSINLKDEKSLLAHNFNKTHQDRLVPTFIPDADRFRNGGPIWNTNENRLNRTRVN